MLPILEFVFSSFPIWLGSVIMLSIVTTGAYQLAVGVLTVFLSGRR